MSDSLVTGKVVSQLSGVPGRAIVSARGHHTIVDSPLPLGGPNEEINPIDLLLSALSTCATFVCETVASELGIPLSAISAKAEGDFDPRGVCGDPVNPRVQAFRVELKVTGPTEEQAQTLVEAFQTRCPIYTTLSRSAPIGIDVILGGRPMKHVRCSDLGFECDHEIHAETEEELLQQVAEHAQTVHNLEVTPEVVEQVKSAIMDE